MGARVCCQTCNDIWRALIKPPPLLPGLAKGQQYCPLCSDIIEDGPESWRQHLAITKCPQNPRTRKRSKLPQFAKRTGATGVKSNLPTAVSPTKLPKITTASNVQSPQNQRKGSQLSPAMTRLKQAPMSPPLATTMPTVKTVGGTTSAPTKKSGFFGFGKK